jgi:hypothetical protein
VRGPVGPAGLGGCMGRGSGLAWVCWVGCAGPRREIKWKIDFEFQMNLDFGRTLRNFTRRFRRNLDMKIFLNSFWLVKDLLKMIYVMP